MRIGIIGLLHESNTFLGRPTMLADFEHQTLLEGEAVSGHFAGSHHEIGGFFTALEAFIEAGEPVEIVPVFAARALPSGTIEAAAWSELVRRMLEALHAAGPLDGLLVAPHGATVSESFPDADGHWLTQLRERLGPEIPIVGTLDPHANLSPAMAAACDALIAYRTNPHLDQHARGEEAARLLVRTLRGEIRPRMHAVFPPLAINIERQMTDEPHLRPLYELADEQRTRPGVLTNSILLGFPYADVPEMGSSVIAVTDGDPVLAESLANELADAMWQRREEFVGRMIGIDQALDRCSQLEGPICLLDMGDNVGGGSAADGAFLARALHERRLNASFVCLYDPEAVQAAERTGIGQELEMSLGGRSGVHYGDEPLRGRFRIQSLHDGRFQEPEVRHGGYREFDQGRTALVVSEHGLTVMLTSKRMVPFSLQQLVSCGLDPSRFRILVAKGVNAPLAAYREVCPNFIRVNTPGPTTAEMTLLEFHHRRRPLFPFEPDTSFATRSG
jgi:microcystin degradation protein MlrC